MFLRSDQCGVAPRGTETVEAITAKPRIGFLQHGVSRRVTYAPSLLGVVSFLRYCFDNPDTQNSASLVQFNEDCRSVDTDSTRGAMACSREIALIFASFSDVQSETAGTNPAVPHHDL
jgi:hypothetical protein